MTAGPATIELTEDTEESKGFPPAPETPDEERRLMANSAESASAVLQEDLILKSPFDQAFTASRWKNLGWSKALGILLFFCLLAGALAVLAVYIWFSPQPSVRFFLIGDWGRNGLLNQTAVADAMADQALKAAPDFIISLGDNMYESGLISAEDAQFTTSFTNIYHHKSLQVPWHAVLGNHDYGEFYNETLDLKQCHHQASECYFSPLHQLNETLRERDSRWHCERWFRISALDGQAELFFIDTNPFIQEYHVQPWADNRGGILEQSWESQLIELDYQLAVSESKWKLVIGHHPVRNNHQPSNTPELVQHLEPVLEKRGVQAYFSGHEHNLQYLHVEAAMTHYVVSGGGSKTDYFPETYWDNGGSIFQHQGSGFVSCLLTEECLECEFLGIADQNPLHKFRIL